VSFSAFVTGFPGFIGKRLVAYLAKQNPQGRISVLVQPKFVEEATAYARTLSGAAIDILSGDIVDLHLGLAGPEYQRLVDETTHLFHLAAISYLGMPRETARRVNVDGTRNVLELGRECRVLERLVHFSTCYVAGTRVGVIAEDELEAGQTFRNAYEQTKYEAERLVDRAKASLPITIVRPGTVVGDSRTGEIDRFEGPYYLGMLLVLSPLVLPLPLPGNGVAPLNVVPVDFVVAATWVLAQHPAAAGKTVHLVDPNPMSARRAYELIAERANRKLPRFSLSARATDLFLRLPGVEKVARPQRAAINYVNHLALYSCGTALELLDGSGVRCPPLASYLDRLVDYALSTWKARHEPAASSLQNDDPLDGPMR
jgi:nucleoside-diphosphate-sugar epimerase